MGILPALLDGTYFFPMGALESRLPHISGVGRKGQENVPLVMTKLGHTPLLTNALSNTETASSAPTCILSSIRFTSLEKNIEVERNRQHLLHDASRDESVIPST